MEYPKLTIKKTENENEIDESRMVEIEIRDGRVHSHGDCIASVSDNGSVPPTGKALWLDPSYDWVVGEIGISLYLVPLKK